MAARSFPRIFAGMMGVFLVWAAHFMLVYGMNGLACARGFDAMRVLGFPLVPFTVAAATLLAMLLAVWILMRALLGRGPAPGASEDPRRFIRLFTAGAAGLSVVAMLWVGLPALQVPACG